MADPLLDVLNGGAAPAQNAGAGDPLLALIGSSTPAPAQEQQMASVQSGSALNSIPRQLGLTARYGLEGLANTAQVFTEPLRYVTDRLTGSTGKTVPLGALATQAADAIGLPKPQNADERVIGDASRLVAGTGGLGAAARVASTVPGILGQFGRGLSANMPQQLTSAAGAGVAGGASREAGGNPLEQAGAALLGGVGGGLAPGAGAGIVNAVKSRFSAPNDQQISVALQRAGVDFSQLPAAAQNALRGDLANALRTGQDLDPQALRRLADFRATGLTPTRGMVTLDPVQITREQNLAKVGANSSDSALQMLARVQNDNNNRLIGNMNGLGGGTGDLFGAGQSSIDAILGQDATLQAGVRNLYQQARDSAGRPLPLNGAAFTQRANQAIDDAMLGHALPPTVGARLNQIARGEVPFTVDYAEQFRKSLNQLYGATQDGATRAALRTVSRSLDETPLMGAPQVNPGNLPAVPGTVPPSPQILGQEARDAFEAARAAARGRFAWQDSGRPVAAALDGAEPDRFIQRFVINGNVADAENVAQNAPRAQVRDAISNYLKRQALNGATDEVGKFSQSAYNKALEAIGDRKLALFFSPEELAHLRALGRVASYAQVQPAGSAVNNSNSGALLLGKTLDALGGFAKAIPGAGPLVATPLINGINGLTVRIGAREAQNVVPGLLGSTPKPPFAQGLLLPGVAAGGLLAAP